MNDSLRSKLVPMDVAVKLVWSSVYEATTSAERKEDILNSLATTFSVASPVYEFHTGASIPPRALKKNELEGGIFRNGGKELHFIDGRQPRRNLAVTADEVSATIEALKKAADRKPR